MQWRCVLLRVVFLQLMNGVRRLCRFLRLAHFVPVVLRECLALVYFYMFDVVAKK